jgi:hypothetical protein
MSYTRKGILGAVAIAATFGAAQFASGEDLTVGMRTAATPDQGINRAAKADRASLLGEAVAPTKTVSIHVDKVPDTSVLVRLPLTREARGGMTRTADQPKAETKADRKMAVACEPVVSVLTEIAKKLQPGRCVT